VTDIDVRARLALLGRSPTAADIAEALRSGGRIVSDVAVMALQQELVQDCEGIGVLEPLLDTPGLTDILVNGPDRVYMDCGRGPVLTPIRFSSAEDVRRLGVRLAASAGRRLDDGSPFVDARLGNGLRFHAVLEGICEPGPCLSLRVPARNPLSMADWESSGGLHPHVRAVLERVVDAKVSFLICGGTGSGKTTLLASMLSAVPEAERIVVVEDSRELDPAHPHVVRLESRPCNTEGAGLVTMSDLVRQALRMRPDRLVVGEVRGAELRDMLQALNTGHEGGCGTVHANSVVDVPARLEALAALGGLSRAAAHAQIAAALSVAIHVTCVGGRRRVSQIGVFRSDERGMVCVEQAWAWDGVRLQEGPGAEELARKIHLSDGRLAGQWSADGQRSPLPARALP
jgi:pilus assembly protein CpaF